MRSRPLLAPLVPVYKLALALREIRFRLGIKRVRRLRWPVVSVGNLSTGGAGKTPLTIALVKALTARGLHVDVLSRGYARHSVRPLLVDISGRTGDFGDEPLLIARETQVPVYVAAERYEAGLLAERESRQVGQSPSRPARESASQPNGIHLLDDGFQHRQLARDVDILLLSRADLNDRLLPAGNLREALHAVERADVIAIPADEPDVEAEIKARGWKGTIWRIRRRMEIPHVDGPVAAFCGIARPEQFFAGIESAGVKLAARLEFADHHNYTAADLARIESAATKTGARTLLTTEKDRVRIGETNALFPIQTVRLRLEIENQDRVLDQLVTRIRELPTN